jgi:hypothetical protein
MNTMITYRPRPFARVTPESPFASRVFAEFPFPASWRDVRSHLGRLAGATVMSADDDGGGVTFYYADQKFQITRRGNYLLFITSGDCNDQTRERVHSHFADYLSP